MSEVNGDGFLSPECFRAYVSAEIKVPNTLIAVSPYVGCAALASLPEGDDLEPAVQRFANDYAFSRSQTKSVMRTVGLLHGKFGIPVLPEGSDVKGNDAIRLFEHARFEVVYMEGVMNILEAVLRLHGRRGELGSARRSQVAELLGDPETLAATVAAFGAAENAINGPEATEKTEAFKAQFNFAASGEPPRAMAPEEKISIQADVTPLINAAVRVALSQYYSDVIDDFVNVLTSPELHAAAR